MKYTIIYMLSMLPIPIIVNAALTYLLQPKKAEKGKVHLPKFFMILGAISSIAFLIPVFITIFLAEPIWVPIVFLIVSLIGAIFIIAFFNCRISYDEKGFIYKNFFGIKRNFTYDQITAIKEGVEESYIYIGKNRVMVTGLSVGEVEFINFVKEKYKALHNGQNIPEHKK